MTGIHVNSADNFGIHFSDVCFEGIHIGGIHLNEVLMLVEFNSEV